ncbi:NitT/TauT family transport system permease protein [Propionibacterium cyclohexanicum]|uniref:NitT/TauT family transport system permease protein n=1 Tax=Propionibacterium cyclohexanicum TaxID=64702 RepID=A0A1H9TCP2_9ACTN|nr:ABC transporter permease [Propionibacterium cyclohexanicum]SER95100.1 NitT/TauT family transport system permease protein [Propionibacterium cyclohexanicum]
MTAQTQLQPARPRLLEHDGSADPAAITDARDKVLRDDPQVLSELARRYRPRTVNHWLAAAAAGLWAFDVFVVLAVPDTSSFVVKGQTPVAIVATLITAVLGVIWAASASPASALGARASHWLGTWAPWWVALALFFLNWELATAKAGALRPPYFPPPGQLLTEAWNDRVLLLQSIGNSIILLVIGFTVGAITGLATGLWMGWSKRAGYWLNPIVKYIGPVPTLAWIPIVFIAFKNSSAAAIFLVALTVWFPITVLTNAGIRSVPKSYFDVCQTLGASGRFLIFKVSLPAALPSIFTGLFMALPTAFVTLTIAETLGVNSGLGWYINWKKGWSAYPAMYAAIAVMVVLCGSLLSLLLSIRTHVLAWQKDLTRW